MQHSEKMKAIQFIRPNAQFVLAGDDLTWFDEEQTEPTKAEIEAGWLAYQTAQIAEAEAKAAQRAALLNKLGITEDEARLLLGGN
jgi:hypothetical protein